MTALVTGAAGFLGGALVRCLRAGGEEPRCFVRPESGSLTNPDDCARAVEGVDLVFHCAAGTRGAPAERFANSVVATKHLLDAVVARERPPRVVLVSSFSVYGVAELGRGAMVDERTPLEPHPERRDVYAQAKLRQERLCWEYRERHGIELVVVRPGVVYGPGGEALSARIGLQVGPVFLHLGGENTLPLCFVESCAEAIALAGRVGVPGEAYNAVDDDLPTCAEYLDSYRALVPGLRVVRLPYRATLALSAAMERYHAWSKGQLPAVLTPYRSATLWGGNRFSNAKLRALGHRQPLSTAEGMRRTLVAN